MSNRSLTTRVSRLFVEMVCLLNRSSSRRVSSTFVRLLNRVRSLSQTDQLHSHLLRILFRSQDLSEVKTYCLRQWAKILEGRVSIQDFTFAKEVRLGTYM
jgi:hypothetical protein